MTHVEAPDAQPGAVARVARQLEMLAELNEIGLDLARAVAAHVKAQIADAKQSGWCGNVPHDPAAAFAKLAQSVRHTIALETSLREGSISEGGLFAAPGKPINLHANFAPTPPRPRLQPDSALADADKADRPETIADDLSRLLDDRERFFEIPVGPPGAIAADLCRDLGLDPARLDWRDDQGWTVKADPADPANPGDTPLKSWRPARLE